MYKKIIFGLFSLCGLTVSAQTTDAQMATLQHGDETQVFVGSTAFQDAYTAAADSGDVITLSSGYFKVPTRLSKSFTLFGAGMEDDTITGTKATVLAALNFYSDSKTDDDGNVIQYAVIPNGLHLEGIQVPSLRYGVNELSPNLSNITLAKCKIEHVLLSCNVLSMTVRQCVITNYLRAVADMQHTLISNSYIGRTDASSYIDVQTDHCILKSGFSYNENYSLSILVSNCILYTTLPPSSTAYNNILIGKDSFGDGVNTGKNWVGFTNEGVWAEAGSDGSYTEARTFALANPDKFYSTDNTEIGLYGGLYPWNKTPRIPRIVESSIDTRTAADGTLKVSVKAEAQTKD